jgi:hypothetical protein
MINPSDIRKLIREAGQVLSLETRAIGDRPTINVEYGFVTQPVTSSIKLTGYVYAPSAKERPMIGATFLEGDAIGIVSSLGVGRELFTPSCILIADGRRYTVAYGAEVRHRSIVLFHRLLLTPEVKT